MAWLRIDDKFSSHPKVAALSDREFRVHVRVLCYCALHRTEGALPPGVWNEVPGLTKAMGRRFVELGLWDEVDGSFVVHHFPEYNGAETGAAGRMRRLRESAPQPRGERWARTREVVFERDNGVCATCGKRDDEAFAEGIRSGWNADHEPPRHVLIARGESIYDTRFIVTLCHSCHAKKTRREAKEERTQTEHLERTQTEHTTEHPAPGSVASRALAGVRVPSPTPEVLTPPTVTVEKGLEQRARAQAGSGDGGWVMESEESEQAREWERRQNGLHRQGELDPIAAEIERAKNAMGGK